MNAVRKMVLVPFDQYQMKKSKEELYQPPTSLSDEFILTSVPRVYKGKVKSLIQHIRDTSSISWNEKGEIVIDGDVIPRTNIIDILKDAVKEYKTFKPNGTAEFYSSLLKTNVPLSLISNPSRRKFLQEGNGDSIKSLATHKRPPIGIPQAKAEKRWVEL